MQRAPVSIVEFRVIDSLDTSGFVDRFVTGLDVLLYAGCDGSRIFGCRRALCKIDRPGGRCAIPYALPRSTNQKHFTLIAGSSEKPARLPS